MISFVSTLGFFALAFSHSMIVRAHGEGEYDPHSDESALAPEPAQWIRESVTDTCTAIGARELAPCGGDDKSVFFCFRDEDGDGLSCGSCGQEGFPCCPSTVRKAGVPETGCDDDLICDTERFCAVESDTDLPGYLVPEWQQCGGEGFLGSTECDVGLVCEEVNEFYSQCVPDDSDDGVDVYGQCGGEGYTGPTVCDRGLNCREINTYYSQCVRY